MVTEAHKVKDEVANEIGFFLFKLFSPLEQGCLPKVIQHALQLLQVIILHIILLPFQSDVHGNISKLI